MSLEDEKQQLRRAAKKKRAALAGQGGGNAAENLAGNFSKVIEAGGAEGQDVSLTVFGYWPMADEIDVRPLMTRLCEDGWKVALPVVVAKGEPLIFRRWRPGMVLQAGGFGTRHPYPDSGPDLGPDLGPEAPEMVPDILLVPLLAFDNRGFRLGWGGGFYDRTLARLRAAGEVNAVGIAYQGQKVDSVPHSSHDQPLDRVVTEEGILEIARK